MSRFLPRLDMATVLGETLGEGVRVWVGEGAGLGVASTSGGRSAGLKKGKGL